MDEAFEKLIKINTLGRVFVTCQARGIHDPGSIGYYAEILEQEIRSRLREESTSAEFNHLLEEQLRWLEGELGRLGSESESAAKPAPDAPEPVREERHPSGYVPAAKSMSERLQERRSGIERLLDNDCITLKLATPAEVRRYKQELLGKAPEQAEEELVANLRNVLHEQVRKFMRKHEGGPWASANQQYELRMDIVKTRSLRSLVTLARALLSERDEWLQKSRGSLTGRFAGGRVKMS